MALVPICLVCRHYAGGRCCAAFADGIPDEILSGRRSHRRAYPGDGGVVFEHREVHPSPRARGREGRIERERRERMLWLLGQVVTRRLPHVGEPPNGTAARGHGLPC
jgi:hypothetical protein